MSTRSLYTPRRSGEIVEVHGLSPEDITFDLTLAVGGLMARAYHRQLNTVLPGMPKGLFNEKYIGSREQIEEKMDDIHTELEAGGSFSAIYEDEELVSFAEILKLGTTDIQVANIASDPDSWDSGFGACALHDALGHVSGPDDAILSLDAFRGSSVNSWYERIGFELTETDPAHPRLYTIGEYKVPLVRYTSASLGDTREKLEYNTGAPQ